MSEFVHGTVRGYKRFLCRCELCRAANAQQERNRLARLKESGEAPRPMAHGDFFTDEEIGFIEENRNWSSAKIGRALDRNPTSVAALRRRLEAGWTPNEDLRAWTAEEDQLIQSTPHLTARQVAKLIDRTSEAVATRRKVITAVTGMKFGGYSKDPWHIGGRSMIAKSCRTCGRLLQALWFTRDLKKGNWSSRCTGCSNKGRVRREASEAEKLRAREFQAKQHAITRGKAVNHGNEWTDKDDEILANPDLRIVEKAVLLGRTYGATVRACSSNGYKSLSGKGDPERDQWHIDNPNLKETA